MPADPSFPAENHDHASREHPAEERPDPGAFARQLFEHPAVVQGDVDADLFFARVVAELFELSSVTREHIVDLILVELAEELHHRGGPGTEAARMVAEVQRDWSQEI